jgi:hypothetical protein
MKKNLTPLIFTVVACVFGFTSCKKDTAKVTAQKAATVDSKQFASQFAMNFYKSITGGYGGADIKNGIKVSAITPSAKKGPVSFAADPLCGFVIDTIATDKSIVVNDTTTYDYGGQFKFTYTCSAAAPDGYINDNSFYSNIRTTNTWDTVHVTQQYTVKALDNTYKLVSMDGQLINFELKQITNGPFYISYLNSTNANVKSTTTTYTLHGVKVDVSSGVPDVVAGTAAIQVLISQIDIHHPLPPSYSFGGGQITFLGNYLAKVEAQIGSDPAVTYTVNMLTGQIVN